MKAVINGEDHRVIYIEYKKGIPFDVKTLRFIESAKVPYWRLYHFDLFANGGDRDDLYAYEAGSGGDDNSIDAPKWADGYTGEFWLDKEFSLNGDVKNGVRLEKPKRIRTTDSGSSINPFKVAPLTDSKHYCEDCGKESLDICFEHIYEDENDNYTLKYKKDNSEY